MASRGHVRAVHSWLSHVPGGMPELGSIGHDDEASAFSKRSMIPGRVDADPLLCELQCALKAGC